MKKKLIVWSGFVLTLVPVVALAQTTGAGACSISNTNITTIGGLLCKLGEIFGAVLPVLIALGVIYFVWGVITYVIASDEEAKKAGRDRIIWGIVGLAVIVGLWGLVAILRNTFGLSNQQNIVFPIVPQQP